MPGGTPTIRSLTFFGALYGFALSQNTVWNARRAIRDLLEGTCRDILDHISEAPFMQLDESPIRMNGRRGYIWLATVRDATYVVATPNRAAAVLDLHFGSILGVPAVSDGYVAYDMLPVRQRCWVHLLREAEECAIRNGKSDISRYCRLLSVCRAVKGRESADSSECLSMERAVLDIASSYPEGHKFRTKLEGAAPYLFTFLRYSGHAAPQQRRRAGDTRHRRPAQEHASPAVHGGGKGGLLGAGLRGAHLPQTGHLSAYRRRVFDQGSGLEAVQAAARAGTPRAGRAGRRGVLMLD